MATEESVPGDGPDDVATTHPSIAKVGSETKTAKSGVMDTDVVTEAATVGSGGDAADQKPELPKLVPLPPPPIIDSLKYYSKQHAKLFGRGRLDHHGRKFPIEAAVRKLKQRGRARFVLERTWYSPLVSSKS